MKDEKPPLLTHYQQERINRLDAKNRALDRIADALETIVAMEYAKK